MELDDDVADWARDRTDVLFKTVDPRYRNLRGAQRPALWTSTPKHRDKIPGCRACNDPDYDVVPARLRRPGSVVLEIDDEDPIFEHLEYAPFARDYDLPRAAGQ